MKAVLLAAGFGTRLKPLTDNWPKCLMKIKQKPLLEYWLETLNQQDISEILINTHYHAEIVKDFIKNSSYKNRVTLVHEPELLGTAGTLTENYEFLKNDSLILIHADNWCRCNFFDFISYHNNSRPNNTVMTMMTFKSTQPSQCGIVGLDDQGIVNDFHEQVKNPPGDLANGAVYIIEPEVLYWIKNNPLIKDISNDVIPEFIGKIATWENKFIHKDIGTVEMLEAAQHD